jgi:hypothetical protein
MSCLDSKTRFDKRFSPTKYSCFSTPSLVRIAKTFNLQFPERPIDPVLIQKAEHSNSSKAREALLKEIRNGFRPICKKAPNLPHHQDSCIVQTGIVPTDHLETSAIPPPAPNNELVFRKPWSTSEVEKAMTYIEKRYPHFMFLEPAPMDFDLKDEAGQCVISELCQFDIQDILIRGKTSFGTLFNTHPSYKPGGHWICVYGCLKSGRICFYDSYGFLPEKEIVRFMKKTKEQYESVFGKPMDMLYNDYQNQFKGVECGTFCIMFLSEMAKHGDMHRAIRYIKDDDRVRQLRTDIFTFNLRLDS